MIRFMIFIYDKIYTNFYVRFMIDYICDDMLIIDLLYIYQ